MFWLVIQSAGCAEPKTWTLCHKDLIEYGIELGADYDQIEEGIMNLEEDTYSNVKGREMYFFYIDSSHFEAATRTKVILIFTQNRLVEVSALISVNDDQQLDNYVKQMMEDCPSVSLKGIDNGFEYENENILVQYKNVGTKVGGKIGYYGYLKQDLLTP